MFLLLHALIPCVAAYILPLFLYFLALVYCHPYILQHINGNVFTLVSLIFLACNTMLFTRASPTPFAALAEVSNVPKEEMMTGNEKY